MLRTRLLTAIVLIPIVIWLVYRGGLPFLALATILLTLAEVEFCLLAAQRSFHLNQIFGIGLVWLTLLDAQFPQLGLLKPGLTLLLLLSLTWQMFRYRCSTLADWAMITASGLYVGLCGSHLVRLRSMPTDGLWWTLVVLPGILFADAGAYFIGSTWGRHKLAPALSFGKTWEGYVGGALVGGVTGGVLASIWSVKAGAGSAISGAHGLILGSLVATIAPLGDLAISMVKRQASVDDSGKLFPGHGGALDRVDSVLWAAVIGYYYASWFTS